MQYYEVSVRCTGKTVGDKRQAGFDLLDIYVKTFGTIAEAKAFIKEQYGGRKKQKMFVDKKDGSTQHVGYIYSLGIVEDVSHTRSEDNKPWYQQDWVEVKEIKATTIII